MTIHDGETFKSGSPGIIDDAMIDAFERDGAVAVRGLFDERWIELLRANVDDVLLTAPTTPGRTWVGRATTSPSRSPPTACGRKMIHSADSSSSPPSARLPQPCRASRHPYDSSKTS